MKKDISKYSNIPNDQLIKALKLSSPAFKVLIYYYSKSGSWSFNDDTIATDCGLSKRGFNDARRELINNDWLIMDKGGIITIYILGLDSVGEYKEKYRIAKKNSKINEEPEATYYENKYDNNIA